MMPQISNRSDHSQAKNLHRNNTGWAAILPTKTGSVIPMETVKLTTTHKEFSAIFELATHGY